MTVADTLVAALDRADLSPLVRELFVDPATGHEPVRDADRDTSVAVAAADAILALASSFGHPAAVALVRVSSGVVVALDLERDREPGRRVVVKVHRRHTGPRLVGVLRAQRRLAECGLPVATSLVDAPMAIGAGWATVETWHAVGESVDVRPPKLRRALATALRTVIESLDPAQFADLRPQWTGAYPPPHSPIFNFAATSSDAGWIDERNARALVDRAELITSGVGPMVVAHTDLRPENVLVSTTPEPRVSAIYDLDSLAVDAEPWLVGGVARAFSTNWSLPDPMIPTPHEIVEFIGDYETSRGTQFTNDEWTLARAGVTHALAYSARCEHALFPDGAPAPWGPGWRDLLRRWEH